MRDGLPHEENDPACARFATGLFQFACPGIRASHGGFCGGAPVAGQIRGCQRRSMGEAPEGGGVLRWQVVGYRGEGSTGAGGRELPQILSGGLSASQRLSE